MLDDNVPQPWQGQTTLVFALAAVAVGLGNVFRLPYLMGANGGAPFFIAYALTVSLVSAPLLAAEVMLGSSGRGSPVGALRWAGDQSGRSNAWSWIGGLQSGLAILLAAKLVTVALWAIELARVLNAGELAAASGVDVANSFVALIGSDDKFQHLAMWTMPLVALLVAMGPAYAMGLIGWLGLPMMAVACVGLLGYSLEVGHLQEADEFLFARDYGALDFPAVMQGVVSALFTLGAGLGMGLCFGGRAPKSLPLLRATSAAMIIDTAFALAIAVIAIPLLFAANVEPSEGLSFVFVSLPYAYANLPLGDIYGALFFSLLAGAMFFAMIALMEPAVMIMRRDLQWHRGVSAIIVSILVVGFAAVMREPSGLWSGIISKGIDIGVLTSLLLLAIFVGWRMPRPIVRGELYREPRWLFLLWWEVIRLIAPVVVIAAMLWLLILPSSLG